MFLGGPLVRFGTFLHDFLMIFKKTPHAFDDCPHPFWLFACFLDAIVLIVINFIVVNPLFHVHGPRAHG